MIDASENIPTTNQHKKHQIPGWNKKVQYSKEIALFWRSIWLNNNSLRQGVVADIMRRTRAKYHYCIREVKKNELLYKKQAMASSIAENTSRNLWSECRKIRQKISNSPICMDTMVGDKNITELFGRKYNELYISVSYDRDEFLALQNENGCNIEMYCIDDNVNNISSNHVHTHAINVEHVSNAITHLKSEKCDNFEGLTSDNFRNGTHLLNVYISLLFSIMLSHGTAPAGFLLSTMVPLIKNKRGNKCDSNNYRAIAISSLLG